VTWASSLQQQPLQGRMPALTTSSSRQQSGPQQSGSPQWQQRQWWHHQEQQPWVLSSRMGLWGLLTWGHQQPCQHLHPSRT
jgi:hypothetical protein